MCMWTETPLPQPMLNSAAATAGQRLLFPLYVHLHKLQIHLVPRSFFTHREWLQDTYSPVSLPSLSTAVPSPVPSSVATVAWWQRYPFMRCCNLDSLSPLFPRSSMLNGKINKPLQSLTFEYFFSLPRCIVPLLLTGYSTLNMRAFHLQFSSKPVVRST